MGSAVRKAACAILAGGAFLAAALLLGFVGFALSLPRDERSSPFRCRRKAWSR
ncbi:MAG: hypothetical protein FD148_3573 [Methylocystaceae bacterium]|nr:MAG: hypothetical protein FD148_3573 [Methylocystaceae bacterium]